MSACIANSFHADYAACLASRDPVEASRLAAMIEGATAAGNARGFEPDLAKLQAIALGKAYAPQERAVGLGEFAKGHPLAPALPDALASQASVAKGMLEYASSPEEIAKACAAGKEVLADIARHRSFTSALAPRVGKRMGLPR